MYTSVHSNVVWESVTHIKHFNQSLKPLNLVVAVTLLCLGSLASYIVEPEPWSFLL